MAGVGGAWGSREEFLHPRDRHGRFRTKWKMAEGVADAISNFLDRFNPRTFQSDNQSSQYLFNRAKPDRFGGGAGYSRLHSDFDETNTHLRSGDIDEPTKKFVKMMDDSSVTTTEDLIFSRTMGADSFGLTPETLGQDEGGIEDFTSRLMGDRGYTAAVIGTPMGHGPGKVTMSVAVPKGTKVIIPARSQTDRGVFFDKDQEFRITKVTSDGRGGFYMMAIATPRTPGETPEPIDRGPRGVGLTPQQREAGILRGEQITAKRMKQGEQPPAGATSPIVPHQNAPTGPVDTGPGGPPPRNEPIHAPSIGAGTPPPSEVVPGQTPTPETPQAPAPAPDFRQIVRDSGLEWPSSGGRRREFNNAYLGVASGKKDPGDMLRELEADIRRNKAELDSPPPHGLDVNGESMRSRAQGGRGNLAGDIKSQEQLADLISSTYNVPRQKPEAPAVKKAAPSKVTPIAQAPGEKHRGIPGEAGTRQVTNLEARRAAKAVQAPRAPQREEPTPPPVPKKAPELAKVLPIKKAQGFGPREGPDVVRGKTRATALKPGDKIMVETDSEGNVLPEMVRGHGRPATVDKVHPDGRLDITEADGKKVTTKGQEAGPGAQMPYYRAQTPTEAKRVAKKAAPSAPAAKKAAPAAPTPEPGAAPDIDKMTKAELIAHARRPEISANIRTSMTKDQLKQAIRQVEEIGPPTPGSRVDKENQFKDAGLGGTVKELQIIADHEGVPRRGRPTNKAKLQEAILARRKEVAAAGAAEPNAASPHLIEDLADGIGIKGDAGGLIPARQLDLNQGMSELEVADRIFRDADQLEASPMPAPGSDKSVTKDMQNRRDEAVAHLRDLAARLRAHGSPPTEPNAPAAQKVIQAPDRREAFAEDWINTPAMAHINEKTAAGRTINEVRDDVLKGKITPDEGIRRLENDIDLNKQDLAEVEQQLRGDVTPQDRSRLMDARDKLRQGISDQELASSFMRKHFRQAPAVTPKEVEVQLDPEAKKLVDSAGPGDIREAAKIAGFGELKGENKDELLQDLVKKIAGKELASRAAKKAAPKKLTPAPLVTKKSGDPDYVDARAIAEGLDMDESDSRMLKHVQDMLDGTGGEKVHTPAAAGRRLHEMVNGPGSPYYQAGAMQQLGVERRQAEVDHAGEPGYQFISKEEAQKNLDKAIAERDALRAQGDRWKVLADRLLKTRRRPARGPEAAGTVRAEGYSPSANTQVRVVADGKGGYIGERQSRSTGAWRDDPSLGTGNTPKDITSRFPRMQWRAKAATNEPEKPKLTTEEKKVTAQAAEVLGVPKEQLQSRALAKKVAAAPPPEAAKSVVDQLSKMDSEEEGRAFLQRRTKAELADIARASNLQVASKDSKQTLLDRIVGVNIGGRKSFEGVLKEGGAGGIKVKPASEQLSGTSQILERINAVDANNVPTMNRNEVRDLLTPLNKAQLTEIAKTYSIPGTGKKTMPELRREIAEASVGRRLDSIAIRGFTGSRPDQPGSRPLANMSPAELADLESELGIKRTSLDRADRIAAIKAAQAEKSAQASIPKSLPSSGRKWNWETIQEDNMTMHGDSASMILAQKLRKSGREDAAQYVADMRFRISNNRGEHDAADVEKMVADLKKMRDAEPDPDLKRAYDRALADIDAPQSPAPKIPASTPEPLKRMMNELNQIPVARRTGHFAGTTKEVSAVDRLAELIRKTEAGEAGSLGRVESEIRRILQSFHESVDGAFQMWRLEDLIKDPEFKTWVRDHYPKT
jgi:hypothetical protein